MLKRLPLEGVTVIELGHSVAAPYAGEILGDLGADVIKIEKADGDDARKWAPPYWGEMSSTFQSLNRNKRSAIVNLKDPTEQEALRRLIVERADVVIQNLRPGSAEEFGLDAESLRALKPDLIYCTIGAFGAKGPLKDRPGYDPLMQAFAGMMSVTGEPDQRPVRVGTSIIDMACRHVVGDRRVRRRCCSVRTSGDRCDRRHVALRNRAWLDVLSRRQFPGVRRIAETPGLRCRDDRAVSRLCDQGRVHRHRCRQRQAVRIPCEGSRPSRMDRRSALFDQPGSCEASGGPVPMDRGHRQGAPSREWQAILDAAAVPNAPMQTIAEVLDHPQTKALGMMQQSPLGRHHACWACRCRSTERGRAFVKVHRRWASIRRRYSARSRRRSPPPSGRDRGGLKSSAVAQAGE